MTKLLTPKEYPTRWWSAQDLIQREVNREAEIMIPDRPMEIRPDYRPHKCQWSQTAMRAFNTDIISFMLP